MHSIKVLAFLFCLSVLITMIFVRRKPTEKDWEELALKKANKGMNKKKSGWIF